MTYTLEDLNYEFRLTNDGDAWGTCMGWLFAIADAMTFVHDMPVPEEWEFRPSPFGANEESYEFGICKETDPEALGAFGDMLWRLRGILEKQGESY